MVLSLLPSINTLIETWDYGPVYLEDITSDGLIVLRRPRRLSLRPNSSGLHTPVPVEHLYLFYEKNMRLCVDSKINDSISAFIGGGFIDDSEC